VHNYLAVLHSHTNQTRETSYGGVVLDPNLIALMDRLWRLYCSSDIAYAAAAAGTRHPVSLWHGLDKESFFGELAQRLYEGKPLRDTQRQALDVFFEGKRHLGLFAPYPDIR
jgi:hypothetical protein